MIDPIFKQHVFAHTLRRDRQVGVSSDIIDQMVKDIESDVVEFKLNKDILKLYKTLIDVKFEELKVITTQAEVVDDKRVLLIEALKIEREIDDLMGVFDGW